MRKVWLGIAVISLAGFFLTTQWPSAAAQVGGKCRIVLMNGNYLDGDVKETADGYEVKSRQGITTTVKKNQVREVVPLDESGKPIDKKVLPANKPAKAGDKNANGKNEPQTAARREVSDAEIALILGDEDESGEADAELDEGESGGVDLKDLPALTLDKDSLQQMLRIGNTNNYLETPHFVLVYTSSKEEAQKLAAGMERSYKWAHKFMEMLNLKALRPQSKLEIYYFGTNKEYQSYGSVVGGVPEWAAGFYMRPINRSSFYDMNDEPNVAQLKEQLKQLPSSNWREKQFINNRIKRRSDFYNVTIVQHEAAHHIHFNVGIFNKRGHTPRWLTEGLAQMFELPPGNLGGSLGATNHFRLAQFNQQYRDNRKAVVATRLFIADDDQWKPERYPHGWAMVHYLWKKKREQFAVFMRKMALREDDRVMSETEIQQEFEDIFGPADDKFHEDFLNYIFSIQFRRSALDF